MKRSRLHAGSIAVAVTLAGPIFVMLIFAGERLGLAGTSSPNAMGYAKQIVPVLLLSVLFGTAIALLPCMIGATAMSVLGRGNPAMRLPAMWALAGGGLAGLPAAFATNGMVAAVFAATGSLCALICRWGVRWQDDYGIVPPRERAICVTHDI